MAPNAPRHAHLKPQEEEWRDIFDRLSERFPTVSGHRVAQALRDHKGHAGEAARFLRDLSGSDVKEADPEDVEHVATLLSSPAMFKHACKEQFYKFDLNHDDALEWEEVKQLVHTIYEEFGLRLPSEGSVRAFFCAYDINHDGVLSEREFRKFFEMFLRYAFFEPLKLRQVVERGKSVDAGKIESKASSSEATPGNNSRASTSCGASSHDELPKETLVLLDPRHLSERKTPKGTPSRAHRHKHALANHEQLPLSPTTKTEHLVGCRSPQAGRDKHQRTKAHRQRDQEHGAACSLGQSASAPSLSSEEARGPVPQGVAFRANPTCQDITQSAVGNGECGGTRKKTSNSQVHASETDMRSGRTSPCRRETDIKAGIEEEWRPLFNNLAERFPNVGEDEIRQALSDNNGHAGKAAQHLRSIQ